MAEKEEDGKKKGKGSLLLFGILGLVGIVGASFVVCFVVLPPTSSGEDLEPGGGQQPASAMPPESWQVATLKIGNLLVNLAGTSGRRYLKMSLAVEYKAPDPVAVDLAAQEKMVELRDSLITLLSGKTLESLDGMDNKNQLKLEIIEALGPILFSKEKGRIEWIYYDEFLTQ